MSVNTMRKGLLILCSVFLMRGFAGQVIDSSDMVFDDSYIHNYELQFYYDNWVDSLEYYKSLPDEMYIPARFLYFGPQGESIVFDSIGVRYKGNSSYNFAKTSPKKPFKFSFDKYIKDQHFYGIDKLNFSNGAKDPTQMREKIAYDVIRRYMPAARAAFATITVEGALIGLYTQVEQVDKRFIARYFTNNDGNLYKSGDNGATMLFNGPNQSSYTTDYSLKTNDSVNDWSAFIGMLDKLNNTAAADFINVMKTGFNLNGAMRYLAFNMVFSNFDSYTGSGRNFYLYDDLTSRQFNIIPWDLNLSFGVFTNNWNVTTMDIVSVSNLSQRPLNKRILENDSLRQVYLRYIKSMIDGPASADSIGAMANRLKLIIDSCVQADSNKLHPYTDFLANINSDVTLQEGSMRTVIPGLTSFAAKRGAAIQSQLANYLPVINGRKTPSGHATFLALYRSGREQYIEVQYTVPRDHAMVTLTLFDSRGSLVATLADGAAAATAGVYRCTWDARKVPSGYYMARLSVGGVPIAIKGVTVIR